MTWNETVFLQAGKKTVDTVSTAGRETDEHGEHDESMAGMLGR